jgi:predicted TPR repeat methyltransferase
MAGPSNKLPDDRLQRVHWTVEATGDADLASRYDQWAKAYDADLEEVDGWAAPRFTAEVFAQHAPDKSWHILDAGAGTGWVGRELARLGFTSITGIDYSPGMLEKAAEKGVYRELRRMNLNEPVDFATDNFDAVICVGTLTYVEPDCLAEFARIVRPGGLVCFSAQPKVHRERGFQERQDEMEKSGIWERVMLSEEMQPLPRSYPEVRFRTTVLKVN